MFSYHQTDFRGKFQLNKLIILHFYTIILKIIFNLFVLQSKLHFKLISMLSGNGSVREATVPIESSNDPLVKWDSYENFDLVPEDNMDGKLPLTFKVFPCNLNTFWKFNNK